MLRVESVTKSFGALRALEEVSLEVAAGEFFCLLGPSGCGKSTLLRLIAGFEAPARGRILLDGEDITALPPHLRAVNMMFQAYALFPHMTVAGNVGYGLKRAGLGRREIAARTAELLELVQLEGSSSRYPSQLSGGQRQRVALARALARRPRLLLLDEPLAALDRRLREATQIELKRVQRRLGTTFVIVTHDQSEALSMADRVAVMDGGRIVDAGEPRRVYDNPRSLFVAGFLGDLNRIGGQVVERAGATWLVLTDLCEAPIEVTLERDALDKGARVVLAIRPERVVVRSAREHGERSPGLTGTVADVTYTGSSSLVGVRLGSGARLVASVPASSSAAALQAGDVVELHLPSEDLRVFPDPSDGAA